MQQYYDFRDVPAVKALERKWARVTTRYISEPPHHYHGHWEVELFPFARSVLEDSPRPRTFAGSGAHWIETFSDGRVPEVVRAPLCHELSAYALKELGKDFLRSAQKAEAAKHKAA